MLHPSYSDLMKVVNSEVEPGEAPVVNSRYSIVMATSKRARQIIGSQSATINMAGKKPLSVAVEELNQGRIRILSEEEVMEMENRVSQEESPELENITEDNRIEDNGTEDNGMEADQAETEQEEAVSEEES